MNSAYIIKPNQNRKLKFVLLVQVKEASSRFEEKLSLLKSEVKFTEKTQKVLSSTRVHIKAEVSVCLIVYLTV